MWLENTAGTCPHPLHTPDAHSRKGHPLLPHPFPGAEPGHLGHMAALGGTKSFGKLAALPGQVGKTLKPEHPPLPVSGVAGMRKCLLCCEC